jgi:hypothetical protein
MTVRIVRAASTRVENTVMIASYPPASGSLGIRMVTQNTVRTAKAASPRASLSRLAGSVTGPGQRASRVSAWRMAAAVRADGGSAHCRVG